MNKILHLLLSLLLISIFGSFSFISKAPGLLMNPFLVCNLSVDAGQDQTFCNSPQTVPLSAFINGEYFSVQWEPANLVLNPNVPNTTASINQTTTFEVTVTGPSEGENAIINGDFSSGFTGFTSDYVEGTGGSFGLLSLEGQYAIASNASDTHNNFASCTDHTGGGQMLVVNGASTINQEIWCQSITIAPNTDYAFSAWVTSVVSGSPAQLQFSVNGTNIGNIFNASPTTCQWNQFYEIWNSGTNTSIELCIVNQNTATGGNDFAIDDITFSPICESTDQVTYTIEEVDASWFPPIYLCASSDPIELNSLLLPNATPGGTWTVNGVNSTFFVPSDWGIGVNTVSYTVGQLPCQETRSDIIVVSPLPEANWISPGEVCINSNPINLNSLLAPTTSTFGQWTINGFPATQFDPAALGLGPHLVSYSVGFAPCDNAQAMFVDVTEGGDPSWTSPGTICTNSAIINFNDLLEPTATTGGTWYIDGIPATQLDPAVYGPGAYDITYVVGTLPCTSEDTQRIEVENAPNGNWNPPAGLCTGSPSFPLDDLLDNLAIPGGTWTINGQQATQFDPANLGSGIFSVSYAIGIAPCNREITLDIEVLPSVIPTWDAPDNLCTSTDAIPLVDLLTANATNGGIWTINGNPSTNLDPSNLGVGNHTITYLVGTGPCEESQTRTIEIEESPIALWSAPNQLCANDNALVLNSLLGPNTTTGGTFTLAGATITNFDPASVSAGSFTLIYTVGNASCTATFNQVIEVIELPNPSWSAPSILCTTSASIMLDDLLDAAATTGGSWTVEGTLTNQFDPTNLGAGTYEVTYTIGPVTCQTTETNTLTIISDPNASWTPPAPLCANDTTFPLNNLLAPTATPGGNWSIDGQPATDFDPGLLSGGIYEVSYQVGTTPCETSSTQNIEILPAVNASWNTPGTLCTSSPTITLNSLLTPTSTPGGTWTINGTSSTQLNPIDLGVGSFDIVYTVGDPACQETNIQTITISDSPSASWMIADSFCADDPSFNLDQLLLPNATTGGNWTLNGTAITELVPADLTPGAYTLTYSVFVTTDCQAELSRAFDILPIPVADFSFPSDTICINEFISLSVNNPITTNTVFHWDFGGALLSDPFNEASPEISWDNTGLQTVSLWIEEAGCVSDTIEQTVFVLGLPEAPQASCADATTTSVTITWPDVALAIDYSITILTGQNGTQTNNSMQFEGLEPEEEVQIIVIAQGECGSTPSSPITCSSLACDPLEIIMPSIAPICLETSLSPIQLEVTIPSGVVVDNFNWSGPGVIDPSGTFNPLDAGLGTHRIYYNFFNEGCAGIDSLEIEIYPIPTASFTNPTARLCRGTRNHRIFRCCI